MIRLIYNQLQLPNSPNSVHQREIKDQLVKRVNIEKEQLDQINDENEYFKILYDILNDFIGDGGKSTERVYEFIIESIPRNLKDFCEYQSLLYLKKIK